MRLLLLAVLAIGLALPALASDGVLEINQTCATQTGCFSGDAMGFPVTIDGSDGHSYRLTSDLTVPDANTDGIVISADDVGIDLSNFAIFGPVTCSGSPLACTASGSGTGVKRFSGAELGSSVKNGSIMGMGSQGVLLGDQAEVMNLRCRSNGGTGIDAGDGSKIAGNTAHQNGGHGIDASSGSTVSDNTVYQNGQDGIFGLNGSTISRNTAYENAGTGIKGNIGSTISDNTAYLNQGDGIRFTSHAIVRGNSARDNGNTGIVVLAGSLVIDNNASGNGGSGIGSNGGESRIEGNNVVGNGDHGIEVFGSTDLIIRNSARANTNGNYSIAANNRVGVIVTPPLSGVISNNGPGAGLGTLDPWANFAY